MMDTRGKAIDRLSIAYGYTETETKTLNVNGHKNENGQANGKGDTQGEGGFERELGSSTQSDPQQPGQAAESKPNGLEIGLGIFPANLVQPAPPPVARLYWPRYRHLIVAALETSPGVEAIEDVEGRLATGAYQVFFAEYSLAITEVSLYARRKAVTVLHGGGKLGELLDRIEPAICAYAQRIGADLVMGQGREGWKRACHARGYRFGWLVMVKDVTSIACGENRRRCNAENGLAHKLGYLKGDKSNDRLRSCVAAWMQNNFVTP